jgi:hypothetical protein
MMQLSSNPSNKADETRETLGATICIIEIYIANGKLMFNQT